MPNILLDDREWFRLGDEDEFTKTGDPLVISPSEISRWSPPMIFNGDLSQVISPRWFLLGDSPVIHRWSPPVNKLEEDWDCVTKEVRLWIYFLLLYIRLFPTSKTDDKPHQWTMHARMIYVKEQEVPLQLLLSQEFFKYATGGDHRGTSCSCRSEIHIWAGRRRTRFYLCPYGQGSSRLFIR